jgi:hypothetical protein
MSRPLEMNVGDKLARGSANACSMTREGRGVRRTDYCNAEDA